MGRKIGVVLSYILIIVEVVSTLFLTPFILSTLGTAEFGVYKLAAAVNAYIMLLDLGVGNAVTRFIAKYRVEKDRKSERIYLGVVTIYYLAIAVCAIVVGIVLIIIFPKVFATGLTHEETILGQKLLGITMINSIITLATTAYTNVVIAYEKFMVSKGSVIIQVIVRMILSFAVLEMGFGSIGLVIVHLLLTIIFRSYYVVYVFGVLKLKPVFKGFDKAFIKEIVQYSSLILLQMLATQINATVDQILIGMLVQTSTVIIGVYSVGTQVVQYFQSIGSSFNGILMPGVVRFMNGKPDSSQLNREMVRVGRILFMVVAPIWGCFLVQGKQFIALWAGDDRIEAYYVALILMTAYLLIMPESMGSQILWAINQHKEQAYLKFIIVILNVVLTVVLIQWNPLFGATIGTFISLLLGDIIVMNIIFKKKLDIKLGYYYRELLRGILPSLLISVGVGYFLSLCQKKYSWIMFIVQIAIMVVVYLVILLMMGMNSYEKGLVASVVRKILPKRK